MKISLSILLSALLLSLNTNAAAKKVAIYECKVEVPAGDDQTFKLTLNLSKAKQAPNSAVIQGPATVARLNSKSNKFVSLKGAATFSKLAQSEVESINVNWSNAAKNPKFKAKECFIQHDVKGFNISDDKYYSGIGLQFNPKMDKKDCLIPHPPKPIIQKMRCVEVQN